VTFTIASAGAPPVAVPASDTDGAGVTTAAATLAPITTPAAYDFALTMRDHAGNTCTVSARFDVLYPASGP